MDIPRTRTRIISSRKNMSKSLCVLMSELYCFIITCYKNKLIPVYHSFNGRSNRSCPRLFMAYQETRRTMLYYLLQTLKLLYTACTAPPSSKYQYRPLEHTKPEAVADQEGTRSKCFSSSLRLARKTWNNTNRSDGHRSDGHDQI
jgi:hypothetical protein